MDVSNNGTYLINLMVRLSLNEIDSSVKKAARGVGMTWGLAEEAGNSARWLAQHGILEISALVSVLSMHDNKRDWVGISANACLTNTSNACLISPFVLGSFITDLGRDLIAVVSQREFRVLAPILIVPFLSRLAQTYELTLALDWQICRVFFVGGSVSVDGDKRDLLISEPIVISITVAKATASSWPTKLKSGMILTNENDWIKIGEFGYRTYVPASSKSRQFGAGAGTDDND